MATDTDGTLVIFVIPKKLSKYTHNVFKKNIKEASHSF